MLSGYSVKISERHVNHDCSIWYLDISNYAWSAQTNNNQQWVQINSALPELWIAVVTQGRPNADQWVTSYKVSYTLDGQEWIYVDGGATFSGNSNRNTKVRNNFTQPVRAIAIRIQPQTWYRHVSLRFDAIILAP